MPGAITTGNGTKDELSMKNGTNGEVRLRSHAERESNVVHAVAPQQAPSLPSGAIDLRGSVPLAAPTASAPYAQALRMSQENLLALQKLGEQTADLHRQFLDGQDKVLLAFQAVLEQQQRLVQFSLGTTAPSLTSALVSQPRDETVVAESRIRVPLARQQPRPQEHPAPAPVPPSPVTVHFETVPTLRPRPGRSGCLSADLAGSRIAEDGLSAGDVGTRHGLDADLGSIRSSASRSSRRCRSDFPMPRSSNPNTSARCEPCRM